MRGYTTSRFSFNVKGGRCEACKGDGIIKIEMHFLPDVYVPCEVCKGKRYNRETLEVKYKGKSIYDVLDMTVEEALGFSRACPKFRASFKPFSTLALAILSLGSPQLLYPEEKRSALSLRPSCQDEIRERHSISWTSPQQDCT